MNKWVYAFTEGDGRNKKLLGGKGANLCEMTQIGLNVPPGFVITTEACLAYLDDPERRLPAGVNELVRLHMAAVEKASGKSFGGRDNPLLVSVRSGSAMSMPGMMDTILNLGLNPDTLQGLIAQTGNERFGYDAYRRFIQLFGKVALGVPEEEFDAEFNAVKADAGVKHDVGLSAAHLADIAERFLKVVERVTGKPFPADPYAQLEIAIKAVFNSWCGKRAVDYRREFKITPEMANGTAVNVVAMVFGNMGDDSATGVGFTRDPGTGENVMFGEYLTNAQGEDVVAGIRTPKPVAELEKEMPDLYRQLVELRNQLESHYKEVQDYEYTIEKRHPVLPADAQRQDERRRPGAHLGGDGQRRPHRQDPGPDAHPAGDTGTVAVPPPGPEDQGQTCGQRPARFTRRGLGHCRVRRGPRRKDGPGR